MQVEKIYAPESTNVDCLGLRFRQPSTTTFTLWGINRKVIARAKRGLLFAAGWRIEQNYAYLKINSADDVIILVEDVEFVRQAIASCVIDVRSDREDASLYGRNNRATSETPKHVIQRLILDQNWEALRDMRTFDITGIEEEYLSADPRYNRALIGNITDEMAVKYVALCPVSILNLRIPSADVPLKSKKFPMSVYERGPKIKTAAAAAYAWRNCPDKAIARSFAKRLLIDDYLSEHVATMIHPSRVTKAMLMGQEKFMGKWVSLKSVPGVVDEEVCNFYIDHGNCGLVDIPEEFREAVCETLVCRLEKEYDAVENYMNHVGLVPIERIASDLRRMIAAWDGMWDLGDVEHKRVWSLPADLEPERVEVAMRTSRRITPAEWTGELVSHLSMTDLASRIPLKYRRSRAKSAANSHVANSHVN